MGRLYRKPPAQRNERVFSVGQARLPTSSPRPSVAARDNLCYGVSSPAAKGMAMDSVFWLVVISVVVTVVVSLLSILVSTNLGVEWSLDFWNRLMARLRRPRPGKSAD